MPLTPVLHGGGQERSVRSGTVPVAGAVALARAMEMAEQEREIEHARLSALATVLIGGVRDTVPGAVLRGPEPGPDRLASHVLLTIEGTDAEAVLFGLDMAGISAASGAACVAGVNQPSHVLEAMGLDEAGARSGLRLTLGHTSTPADIQTVLEALPEVVRRARAAYSPRRGDQVEVA
ncbi:aminotransferase class V-fold PLP-dependent enzyme [Sanguibacter sp. Z1732]|uniref:aminotransferase class V-fold PLP-dependent enzyme n=1 Tax=Sanguibacter sp. Z1732 TaxID=3435412 RepID=UPI003D9C8536